MLNSLVRSSVFEILPLGLKKIENARPQHREDGSWACSSIGVALLWSEMGEFCSNADAQSQEWLLQSVVSRPLLNGYGFLHGPGSGAIALGLIRDGVSGASFLAQKMLPKFRDAFLRQSRLRESGAHLETLSLDISWGLCGDLLCARLMAGLKLLTQQELEEFGQSTVSKIERFLIRKPAFSLTEDELLTDAVCCQFSQSRLIGIAHGIGGILFSLGGFLPSAVREQLLQEILLHDGPDRQRVGWCNGAFPMAILLGEKPSGVRKREFLANVEESIERIGPSLCHGRAGLLWLISNSRLKSDPLFNGLRTRLLAMCLEDIDHWYDKDLSLLTGLSGLLSAVASVVRPQFFLSKLLGLH